MPFYVFPSLFSCLFFAGLGVFVVTRNTRSVVNWSFGVAIFGTVLMSFGVFMVLLTTGFVWTKITYLGACLLPGSLAIFSVMFSRKNAHESLQQWKWFIAGIFAASCWFLYLGIRGELITKTAQLSFNQFEIYHVEPAGYYFFIFLIIALLFILHNLENTYRNASTTLRWKIKYLIVGIFSAAGFHIFLISFILLYRIVRVEYFVAEAIILMISGIFIAFSLVRHRLMDTDVFVSRQVVYNSIVIFVAGAYLLAIALTGYLIKYQLIHQEVTQFLVAEVFMFVATVGLVVILMSNAIRRKVQLYISKHFYRHKYEYDEVWIAFTRKIGSNLRLDDLLPQLVNSIQDIVNTDVVCIFLQEESQGQLILQNSSMIHAEETVIPMDSRFVEYFRHTMNPRVDVMNFRQQKELEEMYAEQQPLLKALEIQLCAPLRITDNFIGLIAVGVERTGEPYSYEDYDLLRTIGIQAASAILNAKLSENLSQARAMETFHKFAAFIVHDLKNDVQNLSLVVQNAPDYFDDPAFRNDAVATIADTVARMNTMIARLSAIPEKLKLRITDVRISSFLDDTLKKSKASKLEHIQVTVHIADPALTAPLDYQYLQGVVINLLSNAAEAIVSETGNIEIRVAQYDRSVELSVADNGGGIPPEHIKTLFTPFKSTKKKGLGIGLYQCKTIIEAHGGKILVESAVNQGTVFRIQLPLTHQGT